MTDEDRTYGVSLVWMGDNGKASTMTRLSAIDGQMTLAQAREFVAMTLDRAALQITRNPSGGPVELYDIAPCPKSKAE